MTAIVLAAGVGSRLGTASGGSPKCLLRVGGRTLIERSLTAVRRAGVRHAVIVNGYRGAQIARALGEASTLPSVRFVHNPDYASSGSARSLLGALETVHDDLLVLESDLLYEERALSVLLEGGDPDAILVSTPLNAGDDVFVHAAGSGMLRDLGKTAPARGAVGALVGITKLSRAFAGHLRSRASGELANGPDRRHYEEAILSASRDGFPVRCISVPDLEWIEIDSPSDLARARREVWPEIHRREHGVP